MLLRQMTAADLPAAGRLADLAFGGGPREGRLRRYLALEPEGWFAVEEAGELLGIGGIVRYAGFAWLGMMAIRPDRQGRGIGRRIAEAAIDGARSRGCPTLCLIATPAGEALYRRLGFVPDGRSRELAGTPREAPASTMRRPCVVVPWTAADTPDLAHFDAPAFGASRESLLSRYVAEFPASSWLARDASGAPCGFLVVQDAALGPCTATDDAVAAQLLATGLAGVSRPLRAGVLDPTFEALLVGHGLVRTRDLQRMRLGPPVPRAPAPRILAHASYAIG